MIGILITTLACGVIAIIGGLIISPLNAITNGAAVSGFFNALLLLTAPFVRNQSVSVVRKLSVCMPTPFPKSA